MRRHWLYGELVDSRLFNADAAGDAIKPGQNVRGWFPRAVANRLDVTLEAECEKSEKEKKNE